MQNQKIMITIFQLHNKSHEGEKCYKCDLCPYASISARHLESHMLIHTDQKPYQCDHCDQSFRQKQLLKRHQNLYHNPDYIPPPPREKTHECPECTRAFRHKGLLFIVDFFFSKRPLIIFLGNLIRHMAAHDPDPTIHRKQMELKLGRQKKIQMIDGQQVEVMPGIGSEEEEEIDMMAVEGSDGQQYVVLEVIQLADGEEQAMVVGGDSSNDLMAETILPDNGVCLLLFSLYLWTLGSLTNVFFVADLNDDVIKALQSARRIPKEEVDDDEEEEEEEDEEEENKKVVNDMKNCFGFDVSCLNFQIIWAYTRNIMLFVYWKLIDFTLKSYTSIWRFFDQFVWKSSWNGSCRFLEYVFMR